MDIFGNEFNISSYTDRSDEIFVSPTDNTDKLKVARDWAKQSNHTIILPTDTLEELEDQWIKFNSMIKKQRRESDWMSIELFGFTNHDRYESLRSIFLADDIGNDIDREFSSLIYDTSTPVAESYIDTFANDPYYVSDEINYTTADVEKARNWSDESNRIIIIPTRTLSELELLWDAFNAMHHKHCRESDWMSCELFGVTNLKHYEYLKKQFLKQDIDKVDSEKYGTSIGYTTNINMNRYFEELSRTLPSNRVIKSLLEMALPTNGIYEDRIIGNVINTTMDNINDLSEVVPSMEIPYGDLPYFSPEDMIDMGINMSNPEDNFYGVCADNTHINDTITVAEWFEMYRATHDGFYTEFGNMTSDWINKVRSLMYGLNRIKESGNELAINSRKQSILELGWNPDIEFTNRSRIIARECEIHRMTNRNTVTRMIDLCGFEITTRTNDILNEDVSSDRLYPVYIVLIEGRELFSKAIQRITSSIYSHAAISFDNKLDKIYSFDTGDKDDLVGGGGFGEENIKDVNKDSRVNVFVFFVHKNVYEKITGLVDRFKRNIDKTKYGYKNIITYLFNIPYNNDWNLVCSQFVDRCLKTAGIDITNKDSSLVSPEDINKAATNEKRIYSVYRGLASKYDPSRVKNLIDSLSRNATPLKENSVYLRDETSYIAGIISNINNIPFLREMKDHISLVKNPNTRRLLEEGLFNCLEIKPYCEYNENNPSTDDTHVPLDFLTEMIYKHLDPIA